MNPTNLKKFTLNNIQKGLSVGLATLGILAAQVTLLPISSAQATQQLFCNGAMNNGWNYSAEYVDGRFTQIRWKRSGQPPQVSDLTYSTDNAQGQPIYRGGLFSAVEVTLVDLSSGAVRPGSPVSVGVEEWGWSRGTCGLSSELPSEDSSLVALRKELKGLNPSQAANQLRGKGYNFLQTLEHTDRRIVERWDHRGNNTSIEVVYTQGKVSNVQPHR